MTVYGNPDSSVVLVQMTGEHEDLASEVAEIRHLAGEDFQLWAFEAEDWNRDLSPWEAPAVFGKEAFGGGAGKTLEEVLRVCRDPGHTYILGGYSLAGLLALWAAVQTDVFAGVAAASPSVWFPGFAQYLSEHRVRCGAVYLSLGDREAHTRNPVMATVGDRIREIHGLLQSQGIRTTLEWNPGNHFMEPDVRTAKAFAWAMGHIDSLL